LVVGSLVGVHVAAVGSLIGVLLFVCLRVWVSENDNEPEAE
jgi:hypothetical protein